MKLNSGFSQEVRDVMLEVSAGRCQCSSDCVLPVTEFHHMLSNSKVNRKLFPNFINSVFNCCPVNHDCHMSGLVPKIPARLAEAYEWYLSQAKE